MCVVQSIFNSQSLAASSSTFCMYIIQNIQVLNHQCRTALWCYKCTEWMDGWDGRPCGRVNLEGTNTVLKKQNPSRPWRMSLTRVEEALETLQANYVADRNNFKEDFFKEEVVEKYFFPLTLNLCKMTFSCCRSADYMSDRLIPLVKLS